MDRQAAHWNVPDLQSVSDDSYESTLRSFAPARIVKVTYMGNVAFYADESELHVSLGALAIDSHAATPRRKRGALLHRQASVRQ